MKKLIILILMLGSYYKGLSNLKGTSIRSYSDLIIKQDSTKEVKDTIKIDEIVVSAGYYTLPKERTTGSFTLIDKSVLNRSNASSLVNRLNGNVPGIYFDQRINRGESLPNDLRESSIRVRGISSIYSSTEPLIILNGFQYDGKIQDIEPEQIENIVVLKDASANSIWGAKAGNGVIVITLKDASQSTRLFASFKSNITLTSKPDLFYNKNSLSSEQLIEVEEFAFNNNIIIEDPIRPLSPVIELLIKKKNGFITDLEYEYNINHLKRNDIRKEALKYLYRNPFEHNYHINIGGKKENFGFNHSISLTSANFSLKRSENRKLNYTSLISINLSPKLTFQSNLLFGYELHLNNGIGLTSKTDEGNFIYYPYSQLVNNQGYLSTRPIYRETYVENSIQEGLLDWRIYPLEEQKLNDKRTLKRNINITSSLKYDVTQNLGLNISYNFQVYNEQDKKLHHENSFKVRNLVNRFTQNDGKRIFPEGYIFENHHQQRNSQTFRTQLNFDKKYYDYIELFLVSGAEIRQDLFKSDLPSQLYGYNPDVLSYSSLLDFNTYWITKPYGSYVRLPSSPDYMKELIDRFLSFYSNVNLNFSNRWSVTGSLRWDASNILGVDFQKKGVPLWSSGFKYNILDEYNKKLIARLTYGVSGNINSTASALPIIYYGINNDTGLKTGSLNNPGNRHLKWEKVKIGNIGIDFELSKKLSGTIEFFHKNNVDLISFPELDPTSGISTYGGVSMGHFVNSANMKTWGGEISLKSNVNIGKNNWEILNNTSFSKNRITKINNVKPTSINAYLTSLYPEPVKGRSRDVIYAFPWYNLDPTDGSMVVLYNGERISNYSNYFNNVQVEDLKVVGNSVPKVVGNLRNTFNIPHVNLDFSFNMSYKFGYHFRMNSIDYSQLFESYYGHVDIDKRWRKPGDEFKTYIPSMPNNINVSRENIFKYSEVHIREGSHIRLNDVQLGYLVQRLSKRTQKGTSIRVNLILANLGVIWKNDKYNVDPDMPLAEFLPSKNYSLSTQIIF